MTAVVGPREQLMLDELVFHFGGQHSRAQLARCLQDAREQLQGSIAPESLPEMALRLVAFRLRRPA